MNILMNNLLYFFTDLSIAFFVNNVQFLVNNKYNLMILNIIIFYDLISNIYYLLFRLHWSIFNSRTDSKPIKFIREG